MVLISRAFDSTSSPFTFAFPFPALFLLAGFPLRSLARSFFYGRRIYTSARHRDRRIHATEHDLVHQWVLEFVTQYWFSMYYSSRDI